VSAARTVIFLSHTSELRELPVKRSFVAAAEGACARAGLAFTDMAYFTARDTSPAQYCIDEVSSADVYVGIIGFRYGSPVRDRPDVSYTELEFDVATEHRLRRLIFMLDESADLPPGAVRDLEHGLRQEQFRRRLLEAGLTVAMVNRPEELEIRLLQALTERQPGSRQAAAEEAARLASSHLAQAIEAAEEIGSADQLRDVVERARLLAVSVLRADRGNISRLEGDELVVEHDHRPHLPYPRRRPLSRSLITAEAIRTRRPVHGPVAEGSVGPDGLAWMVPAGLRYAIQCPMIVGGEVVGVLGLGRRRDEPFTDADGEALLPFAKLAGLLLQNARRLAEARQIGQAKSQFLALAAHELRTPLAVIRDHLSLLEDGTYPVTDRIRAEVVETLVSRAQDLESLVDSLVMAARLEGRSLPLAYDASPSGPVAAE
jgi:GAF domain-containing protein